MWKGGFSPPSFIIQALEEVLAGKGIRSGSTGVMRGNEGFSGLPSAPKCQGCNITRNNTSMKAEQGSRAAS